MEQNTINLAEIVSACASGGYVGGEVFRNELGQEIYFDGKTIKGLHDVDPKLKWTYVEGVKA